MRTHGLEDVGEVTRSHYRVVRPPDLGYAALARFRGDGVVPREPEAGLTVLEKGFGGGFGGWGGGCYSGCCGGCG